MDVSVIGAGLAGCEAAYQLAKRGFHVRLYEMKPVKHSPAHHSDDFAELVCSNSLRSDALTNAVGVLKEEMRQIGSLIMQVADNNKVPAGSALAVDREKFAKAVHDLGVEVGMAMNFKSQNVDKKEWEENLEKLAYLSYEDQCSPANPRVPMIKDMIELMRAAYEGTEIHYEQH